MKKIFIILMLFSFLTTSAQDSTAFDGKKWQAPYSLPQPAGWDVERFPIPISFSPSIAYKGVEDIRFTPGWAKIQSNEYWSYAFLWFLDGAHSFDSKILEKHLTEYYTGLFAVNTDKTKIDTSQLIPVSVSIKTGKTYKGDIATLEGIVKMNDYMTKKPISLNLIAHIKSCEGQPKTFVFFELSPKPYSDKVWIGLNDLWLKFQCSQ